MDRRYIPIIRPFVGEEEAQAAYRVVLSGWLTQGPEVAAFEKEFAAHINAPYACAVSNCTTALHLALRAIGVQPRDEVITVSHSFIATANSVRFCGATPVFVDVDRHTFNMNPALIEAAITEKTKAVLCVHQIGMPCDMKSILEVARKHNLYVVEDAACAIDSEILFDGKWEKIGKPHGDIACFSLHPRKLLTTGDGGMLTTANPEWDQKFRLLRQHGMSVPDTVRHSSKEVIFENYYDIGYNYRMTDIQAAVGREQLKRMSGVMAKRRRQDKRYRELLRDVPGLEMPYQPEYALSNWQSYCVCLPENVGQKAVMQFLQDNGIATRRAVMCSHREPSFEGYELRFALPVSESIQDHGIELPMFHDMTDEEQVYVTDMLKIALQR